MSLCLLIQHFHKTTINHKRSIKEVLRPKIGLKMESNDNDAERKEIEGGSSAAGEKRSREEEMAAAGRSTRG